MAFEINGDIKDLYIVKGVSRNPEFSTTLPKEGASQEFAEICKGGKVSFVPEQVHAELASLINAGKSVIKRNSFASGTSIYTGQGYEALVNDLNKINQKISTYVYVSLISHYDSLKEQYLSFVTSYETTHDDHVGAMLRERMPSIAQLQSSFGVSWSVEALNFHEIEGSLVEQDLAKTQNKTSSSFILGAIKQQLESLAKKLNKIVKSGVSDCTIDDNDRSKVQEKLVELERFNIFSIGEIEDFTNEIRTALNSSGVGNFNSITQLAICNESLNDLINKIDGHVKSFDIQSFA